MYCRECGSQVNEKAEICLNCGTRPLNGTNFCQNCGAETSSEQEICTKCGVKLIKKVSSKEDNPTVLLKAVSCCFPIVGVILYFIWKDEKPLSAKSVCTWAIVGFAAGAVLYLLAFIFGLFSELQQY